MEIIFEVFVPTSETPEERERTFDNTWLARPAWRSIISTRARAYRACEKTLSPVMDHFECWRTFFHAEGQLRTPPQDQLGDLERMRASE